MTKMNNKAEQMAPLEVIESELKELKLVPSVAQKKNNAEQVAELNLVGSVVAGKRNRAQLRAQLEELKSKLKKRKAERSLPGAKVTHGDPNKLSKIEKLRIATAPFVRKALEARRREREACNRKLEPLDLRPSSHNKLYEMETLAYNKKREP